MNCEVENVQKVFRSYVLSFLLAMVLAIVPLVAEAAAPILVEGAMECETGLLIMALDIPKSRE